MLQGLFMPNQHVVFDWRHAGMAGPGWTNLSPMRWSISTPKPIPTGHTCQNKPFTLHNTVILFYAETAGDNSLNWLGVGRLSMAAATGCCSTCPLAAPEPDGQALLASLTSVKCARTQEVGHWLCSQNLWLHSGTAFRSSNPIARPMPVDQQGLELGPRLELSPLTNELWRFYLIQKDLMNGVGFKFTWGQLKLQKLIQRLFDNTVLIQTFSCKLFEQMKALTLDALGACLRRCSMPLIGILWAPGRGGNRWSWRCARVANVIVLTHTFHHHSLETFLRFMHQVGYL